MFDFLHSILKWQFLYRIQIDLTLYLQFCDRNGWLITESFGSYLKLVLIKASKERFK